MTIGIVVGMAAEARLLHDTGALVAIGGGTSAGAERATNDLLRRGASVLISFGLAGGLDPALRPGDIVIPTQVVAGDESFTADTALSRMLAGPAGFVRDDRLLGWTSILTQAADKQRFWRATHAVAVDLESGAVARTARREGMRFAILRAICDPADRNLPPAALAALDQAGAIGLGRVLASVVRQPGQIPALLSLAKDAATARRALTTHLRTIDLPYVAR